MNPSGDHSEVAVVILNYNCKDLLETCVRSVLVQSYPRLSIWVVDNGSGDGSAELIRGNYPEVRVLPSRSNIGFAGLNLGLREVLASGCRYAMYLDSDAKLDPRAIEVLAKFLDSNPDCGIAGPQQLRYETGEPYFLGARIDLRTLWPTWIPHSEVALECDYLGNALIRVEIFERIQFDERFFTYYADTDFCLRAKALGYRVVAIPEAKLYSMQSHTSSIVPGLRGFIPARNRLLFAAKHTPRRYWPIAVPMSIMDSSFRLCYWMVRAQFRNAAFVLIGLTSGILFLFAGKEPAIWRDLAAKGMGNQVVLAGSASESRE